MAAEISEEICGRRRTGGGHTTGRDGQRGAINKIGGRGVQIHLHRGPQTEQNPRQLVEPVSGGEAGLEGFLEAAVQAFNHTIGLRMEGGGCVQLNPQGGGHGSPQGGGELSAAVRGDEAGQTEPRHPVEKEGPADGYGGGVRDGYGLRPPREPVHDGEEV